MGMVSPIIVVKLVKVITQRTLYAICANIIWDMYASQIWCYYCNLYSLFFCLQVISLQFNFRCHVRIVIVAAKDTVNAPVTRSLANLRELVVMSLLLLLLSLL